MIDPSSSEEESEEDHGHQKHGNRNESPGYGHHGLEVPNATPRYVNLCLMFNV